MVSRLLSAQFALTIIMNELSSTSEDVVYYKVVCTPITMECAYYYWVKQLRNNIHEF